MPYIQCQAGPVRGVIFPEDQEYLLFPFNESADALQKFHAQIDSAPAGSRATCDPKISGRKPPAHVALLLKGAHRDRDSAPFVSDELGYFVGPPLIGIPRNHDIAPALEHEIAAEFAAG